jgi:3-isopropylmalate dehydratase small subunit
MLPITLPRKTVEDLMADAENNKQIDIDLTSQTITRHDGTKISFEVDAFRKHCLINGLDDIGLTLQKGSIIDDFERKRSSVSPWLDNASQQYSTV